jgi:hypothetical protein
MTEQQKVWTVYRFFNEDEIVYVGITGSGMRRLDQHRRLREWWPEVTRAEFEHMDTREEAERRERDLIAELKPRGNTDYVPIVAPAGMLTVQELAERLLLQPETIVSLAKRGDIPVAGRVNTGRPYFDWDDVFESIRVERVVEDGR